MSEKFKHTTPELSARERARAEELLQNSNLPNDSELFSDYGVGAPEDFVDTEPDKFAWRDPVSSIMDYQVTAAEGILKGAPANPVTPGKTDKFELPKIPVAADKKPELTRSHQTNTTPEVRLDQRHSPLEVEKRRMQEREANKKKGFFTRLFGGQ